MQFFFFQNSDDSCLAYILGAISNLLSKIGISSTVGIIGSRYSLGNNIGLGTPLSIQQQLLVLLKRSLKRADMLKLTSLLSFDHISLAKFDLKVRSQFGIIFPLRFLKYLPMLEFLCSSYCFCMLPGCPSASV